MTELTKTIRATFVLSIAMLACIARPAHNCIAADDLFAESVAPLFERHCVSCHQGSKPKGGLSLTDAKHAMAGGESGPVIVAGKPDESPLLDNISGDKVSGDRPQMPKNAPPLSPAEVEVIRNWIAAGADWPKDLTLADKRVIDTHWWSLEPPVLPAVPKLDSPWPRTPIDAFVLASMQDHKLQPRREANRRTLIRRLYFDLLGLPPAPGGSRRVCGGSGSAVL